jgi:hypothetical protein
LPLPILFRRDIPIVARRETLNASMFPASAEFSDRLSGFSCKKRGDILECDKLKF